MAESKLPNIALVGSESLLGRELRELLSEKRLPAHLQMVGASESGMLTEEEGEPAVISPLAPEHLAGARVVLLAGSPASSRKAARLAAEAAPPIEVIDLTYALEDRPTARLRAPLLEPDGFQVPHGTLHVVAHPAASILASLLQTIHARWPIRHSVVQIFEPASERGQRGLDELQQQTVSLLSFRKLPTDFFDAQVGFNLLPRYGAEAMEPLEDVEARIDRHLATLLDNAGPGHAPMPSLRVSQAPVFHGYSLSLWIEFEQAPSVEALQLLLASSQVDVRRAEDTPPSNVGAAGQNGMIVGMVEPDRNHGRALWMWVAADNLRLSAENALNVAREILESHAS